MTNFTWKYTRWKAANIHETSFFMYEITKNQAFIWCYFLNLKREISAAKVCRKVVSLLSLSHSAVVCPESGQYRLRAAEVTQSATRDAAFNQLTELRFFHSLARLITPRLYIVKTSIRFCADINKAFQPEYSIQVLSTHNTW